MKYRLFIITALLMASAAFVFANGQQEHSSVSGTVQSITPASNGSVTVTLTSNGKTYTVTVPQVALTGLNVAVGKVVSVKGVESNAPDGTTDITPDAIEQNGVSHDVHQVAESHNGTSEKKETPDTTKENHSTDSGSHSSDN
ncbi:MAG TPA: hypothetical protein VMW73_16595 [Spirochaetia bacterium]|nr:hypothetical protein [Spirochaetia bacterium]